MEEPYGQHCRSFKSTRRPLKAADHDLLWEAEDLCSCEIETILGLKQSNASRHLYRLRQTGLLNTYRKAQWTHYRISDRYREPGAFLQIILSAAQVEGKPFKTDTLRLQDYRGRNFTCATIHEWIPFEDDHR